MSHVSRRTFKSIILIKFFFFNGVPSIGELYIYRITFENRSPIEDLLKAFHLKMGLYFFVLPKSCLKSSINDRAFKGFLSDERTLGGFLFME